MLQFAKGGGEENEPVTVVVEQQFILRHSNTPNTHAKLNLTRSYELVSDINSNSYGIYRLKIHLLW